MKTLIRFTLFCLHVILLLIVSENTNAHNKILKNFTNKVVDLPPVIPIIIYGAERVCPGGFSIYYIDYEAGVIDAKYIWSVSPSASIISGNNTKSVRLAFAPNFVSCTLKVSVESNKAVLATSTIVVTQLLKLPIPTGDNVVYSGMNADYSIPITDELTGYTWSVPSGAIIEKGSGTTTIGVTFTSTFVTGDLCVSRSSCESIPSCLTIYSRLPSSAGAILGKSFISSGSSETYSITRVVGADEYTWELPSGATITSGANTNSIVVSYSAAATSGAIKVTPINSNGSGTPSSMNIFVGNIVTAGGITINPTNASDNYLLFRTGATNLGKIGSDASINSGGVAANMGMAVYGNNKLEFSTNSTKRLVIDGGGNVGIGTTSPSYPLTVEAPKLNNSYTTLANFFSGGLYGGGSRIGISSNTTTWIETNSGYSASGQRAGSSYFDSNIANSETGGVYGAINFYTNDIHRLVIKPNGNIGIGTTDTRGYRLAVAGNIIAEEVIIRLQPWPDFVFHPTYKLRTLREVEQFIKTNNHLPEIPTESEVKENGIGIGEMNAKLLQKIEELTLYIIEQNKRIEALENESKKLNSKEK